MARVALAESLLGPSNIQAAKIADASETINFFLEPQHPVTGKPWLRNTAGLRPWLTLPTTPVTAEFQQDQRAFCIAGATFYELTDTPSYTAYTPTLATNDYLPTICSNGSAGNQLFIVSGGQGYIFDLGANTLTEITDPGFPDDARMGEFSDSYFMVSVAESRSWQISALDDGLTWDVLDVAERSIASDNIAAMVRLERVIALLGTKTSEFWYDSGDPLFPFQPTQGSFLEHGCAAPFTACRFSDTLFWVGQDVDGLGVVWRLAGNTPQTISPPAINRIIQSAGTQPGNDLRLATAFTYQQDGHSFYCLQLPVCEWTLVYDLLTDRWAKRAQWDSTACRFVKWRPQCHMYYPDAGKHLVGDRLTGTIYELSLDIFDDQLVAP